MKNSTQIVVILDRSGSMTDLKSETINGFNSFLNDQKKDSKNTNIRIVLFDHEYESLYIGSIIDCPKLTTSNFVPRGWTALCDAIGMTIAETGQSLSFLDEKDRPDKVLVVIITDGKENSSKEYSVSKIKSMIKHQEDKYNWEFVYLAANQNSFLVGKDMGLNNAGNWTSSALGTISMYRNLSQSVTNYKSDGIMNKIKGSDEE